MNAWWLVAGTVMGLSVGQILFKIGATQLNGVTHTTLLSWINWPIMVALGLYVVCTLFWLGALRTLPLRVAYPVSALGFVIVPVLGHLLIDEPLSIRTFIGAAAIISGVAISTSGT